MTDATWPYWAEDVEDVRKQLHATRGLSTADAALRLKRHGPNTIRDDKAAAIWRLVFRQISNPLVLILVFGALVALALREWIEAIIILTIVFCSALLGLLQEYRASAAVAKLRRRLALTVTTLRDGAWVSVPAATIVPGDTIRLAAGNLVPADAIIVQSRDFLVSEAALTGETFPVEKRPGPVPAGSDLSRRLNCTYQGTSVRSGSATAVVVETGPKTVLGRIAGRARQPETETDFARGLRQFGNLLTHVMTVVALFVLIVNLLLDRPPVDSLLFAVALAVGLSPELLPAIVSVTLSAGARRMAERGVIVRRLDAIENLGSMGVLCTDKTGTLTEGTVDLEGAVNVDGMACNEVLRLAVINAGLETGITNPLDEAIVVAGRAAGFTPDEAHKLDEIPYDFLRKRLTIVVTSDNGALMVVKGAVPNVVGCCSRYRRAGVVAPLDAVTAEAIENFCAHKGREGCRILALATRQLPSKPAFDRDDERDLVLAGFLLFRDPIKRDIGATVGALGGLGINIKIISGDNRHTAAHVGAAIGLNPDRLLTSDELGRLNDEALWHMAETTDIFAEVDPQQKERIIRALQKRGHVVGFLGDGINDAPALLSADVGISVDSAVDVARESADVVLLRPDLDVLRIGVLDGRRTFANTLKYIKITTSANFGNMISMAAATLFLPFLPLAAKQILLNNFLSDIPALAIASDDVDPESLETAQRWSIRDLRKFMLVFGLISTAFDMLTFYSLHVVFHVDEPLFQSSWFVVSVLTELGVLLILRTRRPVWLSRPGSLLVCLAVAVAGIAVALPYSGEMAQLFGLRPIPLAIMAVLLAIVLAYFAVTEFFKRFVA